MSENRDAVRLAVAREMARRSLTNGALAAAAEVDPKTVNDFLSGKRWPQRTKRAAISVALGWPAEAIDQIEDTGVVSHGPDAGRQVGLDDDGRPVVRSLLGYPIDDRFRRELGRLEIVLQMIPPDRLEEATSLGARAILSVVMTPEIEQLATTIQTEIEEASSWPQPDPPAEETPARQQDYAVAAYDDDIDPLDEAEQTERST